MKKRIFLALLSSFIVTISFAQSQPEAKPKKTGNEWHAAGDAPTRSKEFSDRITKALSLDEATSKKVYNLYMANTKSVDEIKFSSDSETVKKEGLNTNQEAFDEKLKGIFTPAQFEKYMKLETKK